MAKIEETCKTCNLNNFINPESHSLHEMIQENGTNLSVGQKQLICIARLIIQDKKILLLDEPTSSLDPHYRAVVNDIILKIRENNTIIAIEHNPELLESADNVIFCDKSGCSTGRHNELLSSNQSYRDYINSKVETISE